MAFHALSAALISGIFGAANKAWRVPGEGGEEGLAGFRWISYNLDIDRAKLEIAARNRLRHESGLPALSMAVELRKLYQAHRQREWDEYLQSNAQLFSRTLRMAVHRYRRRNEHPCKLAAEFDCWDGNSVLCVSDVQETL